MDLPRLPRAPSAWVSAHDARSLTRSGIPSASQRVGLRRHRETALVVERRDEREIQLRRQYLAAVVGIDSAGRVGLDNSGGDLGTVTTVAGPITRRGLLAVTGHDARPAALFPRARPHENAGRKG